MKNINTRWLNTENILRSEGGVEYHPLRPFLPETARVLFLGSFPPQRKRWCMDFYYPNFINDHWRIEGQVFFGDKNHFVDLTNKCFKLDEIVSFCQQKGIAFFDTASAVRRLKDNAADEFLEVVEPTDIYALLQQLPHCEAIVTTGQKATDTLCRYFGIEKGPKVGTSVVIPESEVAIPESMAAPSPLLGRGWGRSLLGRGWGRSLLGRGWGRSLYRLPSSSRAYPLAFDKKVALYREMFERVGLLKV